MVIFSFTRRKLVLSDFNSLISLIPIILNELFVFFTFNLTLNDKSRNLFDFNLLKMMKKSSEKPKTASFGQILMGREPGISHYVFTTASSYDEMMKGFEVNFSSKSFRDL